ncbi:substrate-binding periplasmic protein [Zooshikella harenae]|uniref:Transporter substrate-binding domain-containing protein n=1 Tax=Zooshikella harenae TaxID=2827238 RepID=A0ABS5Z9W4_9GAMM|nr:transporter substrate-binding domain-containing protein [Zooshikella harenae]MBU2710842.1 transporter substrate-binding domain-containing protein [Zooshikella harenae]
MIACIFKQGLKKGFRVFIQLLMMTAISIYAPILSAVDNSKLSAVDKAKFDYIFATESWPPYYGHAMVDEGFMAEVIYKSYARVGKKVHILYTSWNRAFERTKNGLYDGVVGIYYVPEREAYIKFSSPITFSRQALFSIKSKGINGDTIKDLLGYKVSVVRGYYYSSEFNDAPFIAKHEEVSTEKNLTMFLGGRVDLIAADERVLKYFLHRNHPEVAWSDLKRNVDLAVPTVHLGFPKKLKYCMTMYNEFEQGYSLLKKENKIKELRKKHNFYDFPERIEKQ